MHFGTRHFFKTFGLTIATIVLGMASPVIAAQREVKEVRMVFKEVLNAGTDREQVLHLNMRRIPRVGAPPVILNHATTISNIAMRDLGHALWEEGFDVWMPHLRAHGRAEEKTIVEPYFPDDYSFDHMVGEDLPLILQHVRALTGDQKVRVIGYSLGGMVWERFLSGDHRTQDGTMAQSDEVARQRAEMVHSFVSLATPPELGNIDAPTKLMLSPFLPLFRHYHGFLPAFEFSPDQRDLPHAFFVWLAYGGYLGGAAFMSDGVVALQNLNPNNDELWELAMHGMSMPHTDYLTDFLTWFDAPYRSRCGGANYRKKRMLVPTLHVAGSRDGLAQEKQIVESALRAPPESGARVLVLDGFSHIDLIFDKGTAILIPHIVSFMRDPEGFMEPRKLRRI